MKRSAPCACLFLVALVACGGEVGSATAEPKVATAPPSLTPFVVGSPERTVEIEEVLRRGPVIVAYGPRGLDVLRDCHAPGAYAFAGAMPELQRKSFVSLEAELPFRGKAIADETQGERARGGVVTLLLTPSGSYTIGALPRRDQLAGSCKGASHVVSSLLVGAFELGVDLTRAQPGLELGHAPPRGEGTFRKLATEGQHASCFRADVDAPRPPRQCDFLLRLALAPLDP